MVIDRAFLTIEVILMRQHILYWLWLTTARGISNPDITALLEQFNNIEEIYNQKDYTQVVGVKPFSKRILTNKSLKKAEAVLKACEKCETEVLVFDDIRYPDILRTIPSPPYVLYIRGEIMNWDRLLTVGIVGTRDCTDYGIEATRSIASVLAENGITVVSGMAEGIDSVAARAALMAGNKTIAVLGCGTERAYPSTNADLMKKIIQNGTVISEYPPGSPPYRRHFPWRNRIISGLSRGVLVTEAPEKSGSLITANFALEQGRDVFAVPGSINKTTCRGTNALLKNCAKAVLDANDIIEEYVYEINRLKIEKPSGIKAILAGKKKDPVNNEIKLSVDEKRFAGLSEDEKVIISMLLEKNMHIDDLTRGCGFDAAKLTPMLSMLEFGGYIQKIPGNSYKLNIQ